MNQESGGLRDYLEIMGGPRYMGTTLRSSSWSGVAIPAQEPPHRFRILLGLIQRHKRFRRLGALGF